MLSGINIQSFSNLFSRWQDQAVHVRFRLPREDLALLARSVARAIFNSGTVPEGKIFFQG